MGGNGGCRVGVSRGRGTLGNRNLGGTLGTQIPRGENLGGRADKLGGWERKIRRDSQSRRSGDRRGLVDSDRSSDSGRRGRGIRL